METSHYYKRFPNESILKRIKEYNEHINHSISDDNNECLSDYQNFEIKVDDVEKCEFSGSIRIFWGLKKPVLLRPFELPSEEEKKKAKDDSINNCAYDIVSILDSTLEESLDVEKYSAKTIHSQRKRRRKTLVYCLPKLNEETYNNNDGTYRKSSRLFKPGIGTITTIHINQSTTVREAVQLLFEKYRLLNLSNDYVLCKVDNTNNLFLSNEAIKSNSYKKLNDDDKLLYVRLALGPNENISKIYLMEKRTEDNVKCSKFESNEPKLREWTKENEKIEINFNKNINSQISQYLSIPIDVLQNYLQKLQTENEMMNVQTEACYDNYKKYLLCELERRKNVHTISLNLPITSDGIGSDITKKISPSNKSENENILIPKNNLIEENNLNKENENIQSINDIDIELTTTTTTVNKEEESTIEKENEIFVERKEALNIDRPYSINILSNNMNKNQEIESETLKQNNSLGNKLKKRQSNEPSNSIVNQMNNLVNGHRKSQDKCVIV
ncbi:hypothetical protein SNEBB_000173 [Seison nebaliae]|nr:hypothetical protein SNEBB_000173 [Seison nebaliae]